ncbi:MAG: hypothetical protein Q8P07_01755 [bacterium]|nr:hypothetical protein [bacterium]
MEGLIFIIFTVLMVGLSIPSFLKRFKDKQLYNKKIIATEKWAKILYFGGKRRDAGRSYLKLSDGRSYSVWGSASPLSFTFKFKQVQGGVLEGTYKPSFTSPSELKVADSV